MLTAIGRAAAQRLLLRTAPLTIPRSQPITRVAGRAFSTTQWARLPAKATASTTKTKKTTAAAAKESQKKPAAKKAAPKKTAVKKKAAPKKAAPKKKPAVKKPKKELSPEEQGKLNMRLWKKEALLREQPKSKANTPWALYVSKNMQAVGSASEAMKEIMSTLSERYKNLSSYEQQRLAEEAERIKLDDKTRYDAWVKTLTPQQVVKANNARARIRKMRGTPRRPAPIRDDRLPKMPTGAWGNFVAARWASGELAGQRPTQAVSGIAKEWRNMSPSEKAPYEATAKVDQERYEREVRDVLDRGINSRG